MSSDFRLDVLGSLQVSRGCAAEDLLSVTEGHTLHHVHIAGPRLVPSLSKERTNELEINH